MVMLHLRSLFIFSSNMGKFILKSLFLIFLVSYGLSKTDTLFYKKDIYRDTIKAYENHNKEDLKIVFFGNSHSYSSFDPRIIEDELGVKSINMASAAQNLSATRVVADMVLKDTKPDLAVVTLFASSFSENNSESLKSFHLKAIDFLPFSKEKLISVKEFFPFNEWPIALSETFRFHQNWSKLEDIDKPFPYKQKQDHYRGFITDRTHYNHNTYLSFKAKYEKRDSSSNYLNTKEKQRIDDLIKIFNKKGVPVLFVNAPSYVYNMSTYNKTHAQTVAKYIRSKGGTYLEFNEIKDSLGFTKYDYRNPNHLNTNGSIKASLYLSRFIKDSLKVAIEEENLDLSGNRYAQVTSKGKELFRKKLDTITTKKLFGIKESILYNVEKNRYEILFPLTTDTLGFQKVRLEHDVSPTEVKAYGDQKVFFTKDSTKVIFWGTLGNGDVLHYKKKHVAVFSFNSPLKRLNNLSFHAGEQRRVTVFRIDTLQLSK